MVCAVVVQVPSILAQFGCVLVVRSAKGAFMAVKSDTTKKWDSEYMQTL